MAEAIATEWCETSAKALIEAFRATMSARTGTFADLERDALTLLNEVGRQWAEGELSRMAERYDEEVLVDGQRYRHHADGTRSYHTLCGKVDIRRTLYRLVGVHNGPTVVPLELEAGIVENATPALLTSVMQGFAAMPLREYAAQMAAAVRSGRCRRCRRSGGSRSAMARRCTRNCTRSSRCCAFRRHFPPN
jgi:hypothetical protein